MVVLAMLVCMLPAGWQEAAAATKLRNPEMESDSIVTWDCVWFGHYPQTSDGTGEKKSTVSLDFDYIPIQFEMKEDNTYRIGIGVSDLKKFGDEGWVTFKKIYRYPEGILSKRHTFSNCF